VPSAVSFCKRHRQRTALSAVPIYWRSYRCAARRGAPSRAGRRRGVTDQVPRVRSAIASPRPLIANRYGMAPLQGHGGGVRRLAGMLADGWWTDSAGLRGAPRDRLLVADVEPAARARVRIHRAMGHLRRVWARSAWRLTSCSITDRAAAVDRGIPRCSASHWCSWQGAGRVVTAVRVWMFSRVRDLPVGTGG